MSIKRVLYKIYRFFFPIDIVTMYRKMGVKIGANCKIQGEVIIDYSHYWHIEIGNNVTIAPRVHILAHDASTKHLIGYTKIGKVKIGDNVFIGAGTIILPGTIIGSGSIIGAGSIIKKDVPKNCVVAGSPAKFICSIDDYIKKINEQKKIFPLFEEEYTLRYNITEEMKEEMNKKMKDRFGFVR